MSTSTAPGTAGVQWPSAATAIPLIGRDEELAVAGSALARGGCVIAGAAGVGKSRLAAEVAARTTGSVERVVATSSAAKLPFGAFSHLLASVGISGSVIPAFLSELRERGPGGRPTVVVDDAHLLDDASAALLVALAATGAAGLVITIRSHEPAPDAVVSLWKERTFERIDLQPLSRGQVRKLVDAALGSTCHVSVYSRIFELTEGNPLFVMELLHDSVHSGALAVLEDRWHWTGRSPVMEHLRDLIGARTHTLSDPARRALELLALGGPIDLRVFERLVAPHHTEELERGRFASVRNDRERVEVELTHPLYGEVIRAEMPGSVARELQRDLAQSMREVGPLSADEKIQVASWMLEAGSVDHDLFVEASRQALGATAGVQGSGWGPGDPTLAIRLADAAGPTLAATLCAAAGRMATNRSAEVEALLGPFESDASQASLEISVAYLRTRGYALHWSGTGTDAAFELLDRSKGWHTDRNWTAFGASMRAWMLVGLGSPAECRRVVEPFLQAEDLDPHIRLEVLIVLGFALSRLGLIDRCEALDAEIQALARRLHTDAHETAWAEFMVDGLARTEAARDVDGVAARLQAGLAAAQGRGDAGLTAALLFAEGRLSLVRGHALDAVRMLEEAVDGLVFGDPRNALGLAFTYLSRAHSLRRDVLAATNAQLQAEQLLRERPRNQRLRVEIGRARAWVDAASGHVKAARERLLAVAEEAGEDVMGRGEATYGALRLGANPRACAETLATLDEQAESDLLTACTKHAHSIAAHDAQTQLDAAVAFADLGVDLFAAEAAAGASRIFRKEGRHASARRAAALSMKHEQLCQGARTPMLDLRSELVLLTPREREVAELAARGRTNASIADELVLSVRSVETYLLRASRKLGVRDRHDLHEVLGPADELS